LIKIFNANNILNYLGDCINFSMKHRVIIILFVFYLNALTGQTSWQTKDYSKWNHTNFRSNPLFHQTFSTSDPDYLLLNAAVFFMTNEQRTKHGVSTLPHHKLLEVAAYNHSMKMATTGFFSHRNSVDASRASTEDRGRLAGIANPKIAENIAYNYPNDGNTYLQVAEKLINQWMNSPGHRSNILSTEGKQMGAGTYYINGRIYGTQVFQWFYFVKESPSGGTDQLPSPKYNSNNSSKQNSTVITKQNSNTTNNNSDSELKKLNTEIANLNRNIINKDQTISQLRNEKNNLNDKIYQLQKTQKEKDAKYNQLYSEYQALSKQKSKRENSPNKPNALLFKMGIIAFYPSISNTINSDFNENFISYGGDVFLGANYGTTSKRNTIGIAFRAIQTNQQLTKAMDSSASAPIQYYDAELTTILREWFSFGVGVTYKSRYGSTEFTINPSASLGLCIGPKNWKIQLFQQASLQENNSISGRASVGFSLVL